MITPRNKNEGFEMKKRPDSPHDATTSTRLEVISDQSDRGRD